MSQPQWLDKVAPQQAVGVKYVLHLINYITQFYHNLILFYVLLTVQHIQLSSLILLKYKLFYKTAACIPHKQISLHLIIAHYISHLKLFFSFQIFKIYLFGTSSSLCLSLI
jgi:hypothetical protein